jgi:hypothetical protein
VTAPVPTVLTASIHIEANAELQSLHFPHARADETPLALKSAVQTQPKLRYIPPPSGIYVINRKIVSHSRRSFNQGNVHGRQIKRMKRRAAIAQKA